MSPDFDGFGAVSADDIFAVGGTNDASNQSEIDSESSSDHLSMLDDDNSAWRDDYSEPEADEDLDEADWFILSMLEDLSGNSNLSLAS
jgi:hypothetical protein